MLGIFKRDIQERDIIFKVVDMMDEYDSKY